MNLRVVATDGLDNEAAQLLRKNPDILLDVQKGVSAQDLVKVLKDADVVIIRSATKLMAPQLEQLPHLKGVLRAGVGIDNIDLKAAEAQGIWVWNAPTGNFQSTAEMALAHIFTLARRLVTSSEGSRHGKWLKNELGSQGRQISGSNLGIYGAGNIGLRLAHMAQALGMHVRVCDPVFDQSKFPMYQKVDFDTLLAKSDFISIHAPLLDSTRHAFNIDAFRKMKRGSFIVNCARGGVIKDADLLKALEENFVAGAGLDVFEIEPPPFDNETYHKLLTHPFVVSSPHLGASTQEAQKAVGLETAEKILSVLAASKDRAAKAPRALNNPGKARLALSF